MTRGSGRPAGRTVAVAVTGRITDNDVVAFFRLRFDPNEQGADAVYLWEKGAITPVATVGREIPGPGTVANLFGILLNNHDRTALVTMGLNSTSAPTGFYRWANGQFTLLFTVCQEMPGGGKLDQYFRPFAFNDAGQFAFLATLADGSTAAYLVDTDGTLSLILKSGASTPLGTITAVGPPSSSSQPSAGIGLNSKGQVALPVQIDGGPATLVLLTPSGS